MLSLMKINERGLIIFRTILHYGIYAIGGIASVFENCFNSLKPFSFNRLSIMPNEGVLIKIAKFWKTQFPRSHLPFYKFWGKQCYMLKKIGLKLIGKALSDCLHYLLF